MISGNISEQSCLAISIDCAILSLSCLCVFGHSKPGRGMGYMIPPHVILLSQFVTQVESRFLCDYNSHATANALSTSWYNLSDGIRACIRLIWRRFLYRITFWEWSYLLCMTVFFALRCYRSHFSPLLSLQLLCLPR